MFVSESKICETIKIRTELKFYCNGSGNPKCQSRAVKRYYYETGKFSLKIPCFAKSCRKGSARPAKKNLIYEFWGAKKAIFWKNLTQFSMPMTKMVVEKCKVFFRFISENAILEVKIFNKIIHSLGLTSQKLYWKQQSVRITLHETKENFWKCHAFANSLTNCGFSPPNCTKLLDSLVQAQKQYGSN